MVPIHYRQTYGSNFGSADRSTARELSAHNLSPWSAGDSAIGNARYLEGLSSGLVLRRDAEWAHGDGVMANVQGTITLGAGGNQMAADEAPEQHTSAQFLQ